MPKMDATPPVPPPNSGDILSRIGPLKPTNLGRLKVSLYGEAGTGKTRLACSFPKPLLLIGGEDGTASVVGTPGVDFVQLSIGDICKDFARIIDAVRGGMVSRQSKKPFATVVVDTLSSIRDIRISEILGWNTVPEQMGFRFATMDQWSECAQNLKDMMRPLIDLPKFLNVNIVVVAHEQTFIPGDREKAKGIEHCQVKAGSALGKSLCDWLNKEVDYIAQLLIRDKVDTVTSTDANGTTASVQVATGKKEYALRVGAHSVYYTKFRLPNGRVLTEEYIPDPTYEKLAALIAGK